MAEDQALRFFAAAGESLTAANPLIFVLYCGSYGS